MTEKKSPLVDHKISKFTGAFKQPQEHRSELPKWKLQLQNYRAGLTRKAVNDKKKQEA